MLTVRIIPCLDVKDGTVVKGIQFGNLKKAGSPADLAARYEAEGADELVVLDIAATPDQRAHRLDTVRLVRERLSIPLTVGGGVRTIDDAGRLLEAGADKVGINSAAFYNPDLLTMISERYGRQCTVLALDAARSQAGDRWETVIRSGREHTGRDAVEWAREAARAGAGEILLTSWDRDGSRDGYDLDLLRAITGAVTIPVIASGGGFLRQHFVDALDAGADAVLAASVFHFQKDTIRGIKEYLHENRKEVRL